MKLDKKVYLILGAILLIAILGICWMVNKPKPVITNPNEDVQNGEVTEYGFIVNNPGTDLTVSKRGAPQRL